MGRDPGAQGLKIISPLESRDDAPLAPAVGEVADPPRQPAVVDAAPDQPGQRVAGMGVEAGRDRPRGLRDGVLRALPSDEHHAAIPERTSRFSTRSANFMPSCPNQNVEATLLGVLVSTFLVAVVKRVKEMDRIAWKWIFWPISG